MYFEKRKPVSSVTVFKDIFILNNIFWSILWYNYVTLTDKHL